MSPPPTADRAVDPDDDPAVRRRAAVRIVLAMAALGVAGAVWSIGFASPAVAPVIPPDDTPFSLDLRVVASMDHEIVYAVEQRARPHYRIFEFDPATGADRTVFSVPEDAIVSGIARSPDDTSLAVAYTPDHNDAGTGVWLLDPDSGAMTEVTPGVDGVYLVDPSWAADGTTVFVTVVDRRGDGDALAVGAIDLTDPTPTVEVLAEDVIEPLEVDGVVHALAVDDDLARRRVAVLSADGDPGWLTVDDGGRDLDHLVRVGDDEPVVAVLDVIDDGGVTFGEPAWAHGSHVVPSTWWSIGVDGAQPSGPDAVIVHDAVGTDHSIVEATGTGLAITTGTSRIELITSRTIRFVAV